MADQHDCICKKEREIDDLKKEIDNLKSLQYTDHDLLIRIDTKFDAMTGVIETLSNKIDILTTQPANRFEKLKLAAYVAVVTAVVTYVVQILIGGL